MSINLSKNNIKNIKMSDKYYAYIKLMVILFFVIRLIYISSNQIGNIDRL